MPKNLRNPDINSKPAVVDWFKKYPEAKYHFKPLKNFLIAHYKDSNHGFINKKNHPEYRFNTASKGEIHIRIIVSKGHSHLRFILDSDFVVSFDFEDYRKDIVFRNSRVSVVDLVVSSAKHIKQVINFLMQNPIHNFDVPEINSWKKYDEFGEEKEYTTIRLYSDQKVEVTSNHSILSKSFIRWLKSKGFTNIQDEYMIAATRDRIDVLFCLNGKAVLSELKTVDNSSSKRAIREALGQILDYQYYNDNKRVEELWIVLNGEVSYADKQFIDVLRDKHKIPLTLVWGESEKFFTHPKL